MVSLAPNLTELVAGLGAAEQLVGISTDSNYPPTLQHLPTTGSYYRPSLEQIVALKPDLCLAVADGTPHDLVARLRAMEIAVLVLNPSSLEGLQESIRQLGQHLDKKTAADSMLQEIEQVLHDLEQARNNCASNQPESVLLVLQHNPLIVQAKGGYLDELVERAGAKNVVVAPMPYPRLSRERVVELKPGIVLRIDMQTWPHEESILPEKADSLFWPQARVYALNPDLFARPSLRSLKAAVALAPLLCRQPPEGRQP